MHLTGIQNRIGRVLLLLWTLTFFTTYAQKSFFRRFAQRFYLWHKNGETLHRRQCFSERNQNRRRVQYARILCHSVIQTGVYTLVCPIHRVGATSKTVTFRPARKRFCVSTSDRKISRERKLWCTRTLSYHAKTFWKTDFKSSFPESRFNMIPQVVEADLPAVASDTAGRSCRCRIFFPALYIRGGTPDQTFTWSTAVMCTIRNMLRPLLHVYTDAIKKVDLSKGRIWRRISADAYRLWL